MSVKPYLLNDVPEDLWEALRRDAQSRETPDSFRNEEGRKYPARRTERRGTSLNNVVCEILAGRYSIPFEPTNRGTFDQMPVNRSLYLRLPEPVVEMIDRDAVEAGNKRLAILNALAQHYLLSLPVKDEPRRKPRKRRHGRPRGRR